MKVSFVMILLIVFCVIIQGCADGTSNVASNSSVPAAAPTPAATIDELASGKKVYETNCMACHEAAGTGGKLTVEGKSLNVEDLTSEKIKAMSDEKIIGYIMKGVPSEGMPAFKDKLSEGEMRDVVLYIRREFHKQ